MFNKLLATIEIQIIWFLSGLLDNQKNWLIFRWSEVETTMANGGTGSGEKKGKIMWRIMNGQFVFRKKENNSSDCDKRHGRRANENFYYQFSFIASNFVLTWSRSHDYGYKQRVLDGPHDLQIFFDTKHYTQKENK